MNPLTNFPRLNLLPRLLSQLDQDQRHLVYVVDDDVLYNHSLEFAILGYQGNRKLDIKTYYTGEDCLNDLKSTRPEIVILDYYLNSEVRNAQDGIRVLKQIKEQKPEVYVIMLSNQERLDIAVSCLKCGAYDYVLKNESAPVRLNLLINLILYSQEMKKKMNNYLKWNLILASLFVLFLFGMIFMAWRYNQ